MRRLACGAEAQPAIWTGDADPLALVYRHLFARSPQTTKDFARGAAALAACCRN